MAFKSLIIFALVASVGRVVAAPLAAGHLGARRSCQGTFLDTTLAIRVTSADTLMQEPGALVILSMADAPIFLAGSPSSMVVTSPFRAESPTLQLLRLTLLLLLCPLTHLQLHLSTLLRLLR